MTITVKTNNGMEFGTSGKMLVGIKVFTSQVDFDTFLTLMKEFDAEDEILGVHFDCR